MAYVTQEEVLASFSRLNDLLDRGRISSSLIDLWISSAEGIINSKIALKYDLPLSETPAIIKSIALQLVEYFAEKELHTPTSSGDEVPWLYPRYDRLMELLDEIRDGKIALTKSDGTILEPSNRQLSAISSNHEEIDQIFSMRDAWDSRVDPDYGEDE